MVVESSHRLEHKLATLASPNLPIAKSLLERRAPNIFIFVWIAKTTAINLSLHLQDLMSLCWTRLQMLLCHTLKLEQCFSAISTCLLSALPWIHLLLHFNVMTNKHKHSLEVVEFTNCKLKALNDFVSLQICSRTFPILPQIFVPDWTQLLPTTHHSNANCKSKSTHIIAIDVLKFQSMIISN